MSLAERTELTPSAADPFKDLIAAFERDVRQDMTRVLEQRSADLHAALRPTIARERLDVVRALAQALNETFVRMRRYESDWQWCDALLDAAATLSRRAAFFSISGDNLCFQGARGLDERRTAPVIVPLDAAPGFRNAVNTCAPVETRRTEADLSSAIAGLFGDFEDVTVTLVPVVARGSAAGVLYLENAVEISALETIAGFAGATLEAHAPQEAPERGTVERALPLAGELRAEGFARVETARILLQRPDALRRGRQSRDIYGALKTEIDAVRSEYARRFPGAADVLHAELVRTLAQNDPEALGGQYPGPLA